MMIAIALDASWSAFDWLKLPCAICRSLMDREKYATESPVRRTTNARTMTRAAPRLEWDDDFGILRDSQVEITVVNANG